MGKRIITPIEKGRIRLRLLEATDLPMTLRWRNEDHIRKWFVHSKVISPDQHQKWYEQYSQRDDDYVFIIEEKQNFQKPVGQVSIYKIDWNCRSAEFGRLLIGEQKAQRKGIAKEATGLLLNYAFTTLGIDEVELLVKKDNKPAIAIYRSLGFCKVSDSDDLKKMVINRWNVVVCKVLETIE